jgi:hypothetical protein
MVEVCNCVCLVEDEIVVVVVVVVVVSIHLLMGTWNSRGSILNVVMDTYSVTVRFTGRV